MRHTAEKEGFQLPAVRLAVKNEIPMAGGLGSSAAAAIAGIVPRTQQLDALSREKTRYDTRAKSKATQIMPAQLCTEASS